MLKTHFYAMAVTFEAFLTAFYSLLYTPDT